MPKGRDFTSLVTQAPGANIETPSSAASRSTAPRAGENRFIIDGAETTNLQSGVSGKAHGHRLRRGGPGQVLRLRRRVRRLDRRRHQRHLQDRRRTSSAATRSSTTRATRLDCEPPARRCASSPPNSNAAEYVTYPKDAYSRWEPGFTLGGPIVKDKAVVLRGLPPRVPAARPHGHRPRRRLDAAPTTRTFKRHNLTANITGAVRRRSCAPRWPSTSSGYKQRGPPARRSTAPSSPTANYAINDICAELQRRRPASTTRPSNKVFLSLRGGYFRSDIYNEGVYDEHPLHLLHSRTSARRACRPSTSSARQLHERPDQHAPPPQDIQERINAQFDTTFFFSGGGEHQLKAGVQFDRIAQRRPLAASTGNLVRIYWNRRSSRRPDDAARTATTRSAATASLPEQGFITAGQHQPATTSGSSSRTPGRSATS